MNNGRRGASKRPAGYLMAMSAAVLFGFNGNLSRLLFDEGVTPLTLVEFRMIIGGICLLAVMIVGRRQELKIPRKAIGWILAFGISLALVTYTYFVAISRLPIAIALVIQFSAPAWMVLVESIWHRRLPTAHIIIALGLTIIGIILLTGLWSLSLNGLDAIGLVFAVLSVVTFIGYLLLGRRVGRDLPPLAGTSFGALVAGIFWLFVQPPWATPSNTWEPSHLLLIVVVGIAGMAIPFTLELAALRRLDAARVGIAAMLELVAAGVIAYFWLGQRLNISQILGGLLVMVGIAILQLE